MGSVTVGRRHHRVLSGLAFGLLALVAELAGRSLTHRFDLGRHVASPGNTSADYYPFLLAVVKIAIALLATRLAWRVARAHTAERAARRLLRVVGARPAHSVPRVRFSLSPRLWLAFFALTALIYLIQIDAETASAGRWPLLGPWLHSSALPVFAVLSVVAALLWSAAASWLSDYERYAEQTVAHASGLARARAPRPAHRPHAVEVPPRRLFGISFESRPPPVPA